MNYNDYSLQSGKTEINTGIKTNELNNQNNPVPEYIPNENQINPTNEEIEELDGTDNLRYKDNNMMNNFTPFYQQRLDSCDSSAPRLRYTRFVLQHIAQCLCRTILAFPLSGVPRPAFLLSQPVSYIALHLHM